SFYDYASEPLTPAFTENDVFIEYRRSWVFGANGANKVTFTPALHYDSYFEQSYLKFGANRQPPLGTRSGTLAEMNNYQVKLTYDRALLESLYATAGFDGLLASMYRTDRFNIVKDQVLIVPRGYAPPGHWLLAGLF